MYNLLMRYLGIDYGLKRVGTAVSDEGGRIAFPERVIPNTKHLVETIAMLCKEKGVGEIVLGESKDFTGKDNPVAKKIAEFKKELEAATGKMVHYEPEFWTSVQAARWQGKTDKLDASAAAIILQSYLDRTRHE